MTRVNIAGIEAASRAYQSAIAAMQARAGAASGYAVPPQPRLVHQVTGVSAEQPPQPLFSPARHAAIQQQRMTLAARMGLPR